MVKRDFGQQPLTEQEIIECYWYPVKDNLIGGWSVCNVNMPTSDMNVYEGQFELGSFMTEYQAKHIADVHNKWYQDEVLNTYKSNIEVGIAYNISKYYNGNKAPLSTGVLDMLRQID